MVIKKAREFTGLWVFDKWKGYKCLHTKNPATGRDLTG